MIDVVNILDEPRRLFFKLEDAKDKLEQLRADECANGAIRYDKDKVVSSPSADMLFNKVAPIIELEADINELRQQFDVAREDARSLIGLIDNDIARQVCMKYYCDCKSISEIGYEMMYSRNQIYYRRNIGIAIIDKIVN